MAELKFEVKRPKEPFCEACTKVITMDLEELDGVTSVRVDIDEKNDHLAHVHIEADREVALDEVREALKDSEYEIGE